MCFESQTSMEHIYTHLNWQNEKKWKIYADSTLKKRGGQNTQDGRNFSKIEVLAHMNSSLARES